MSRTHLERLLDPQSIAVVGASASPEKAGYQAVKSLARFSGRVIPINPKATEILGHACHPSLAVAREKSGISADLVILAVPAAGCLDAARDAAAAGCGGLLVVSGGFGEVDPTAGGDGARLQDELLDICRGSGLRLLGPNTSGFIRPKTGCCASFAPGVDQIADGNIAVVAQSGGVNLTLAFLIHRLGFGLSFSAGLGNAVDVEAADVLEMLGADPGTRAIALHLEGVANGRRLYEVLRDVTRVKPVVAVAVGRADIGDFARSHTGNLIGSYERKIAMLRQAGVVVVASTDEVADAVTVLSRTRLQPAPDPGVAIVTGQAGPALLIVDQLRAAGVRVPELEAASMEAIGRLLPPLTYVRNPVDTGRPGPTFAKVLQTVCDDPNIDAVGVYAINEPAAVDPGVVFPAVKKATAKPVLFGTMGDPKSLAETMETLAQVGVPALASPERLALALRVLVEDARYAYRMRSGSAGPEGESGQALALTLPCDEAQGKALLARYGVAVPKAAVCATRAEAASAFAALNKPVVAKILSVEIAHKTEAGGVKLGLKSDADLAAALDALDAIPIKGARRYLLEEMAVPGLELIVGAVRDPSFGPVVMVGLGGITAEALRDSALRLAPIDETEALEMLGELRGRALLEGFRGAPPVDRKAVARAIVAVARLLSAHPEISEIDVNPLRAHPDGVVALDALIVG